MHHHPSSASSPTTSTPFLPSFGCQAGVHKSLDVLALAQTLISLVASASTPPPSPGFHRRLDLIEEEVRSIKEQTTRAFLALNAKVDRLEKAVEVNVIPVGPTAEALNRQTRQCTAELEEFRVQLAEVIADTKGLMDAIEEADTGVSTKVRIDNAPGDCELT
ncbi:hypothetical protein FRC04_011230 [Tulasnella sp. 424]|nr:hypothetical protein FRC04_011230 [Tulasnella sp. 424]KAG8971763.1 hypothetical protein FRC05_010830 [Tulasnella sp. 425]